MSYLCHTLLVDDAGPSLFVEKYVQEALGNCLGMGEGYKPHVHMMLFSHDASNFQLPTQVTSDDVTVYDFVRSPCEDMGKTCKRN